ncbi:hypothetical protein ACFL34_04535, partial [Candidatus Sumerlaeota bacterium]
MLFVRGFSPDGTAGPEYWDQQRTYLIEHFQYDEKGGDFWDTAEDSIVDGTKGRDYNAYRVKEYLERKIQERIPSDPQMTYDVVAHSFGGQIFNKALSLPGADLMRSRLNKVVLVDPATLGSPAADFLRKSIWWLPYNYPALCVEASGKSRYWDSVRDLQRKSSEKFSESAEGFSFLHHVASGEIYIISSEMARDDIWWGSADSSFRLINSVPLFFGPWPQLRSNDGMLEQYSQEFTSNKTVKDIKRFDMNSIPQDHTQVLKGDHHSEIVDRWIGYWLTGIDRPAAPKYDERNNYTVAVDSGPTSNSFSGTIESGFQVLSQDEETSWALPIEAQTETANISIVWMSDNEYELNLRDASSQLITSDTAQGIPDIEYEAVDLLTSGSSAMHVRRY